jgi:virginiamycin B lyase
MPRRPLVLAAIGLLVLALAGTAWLLAGSWSRPRFVEYPMAEPGDMPVAIASVEPLGVGAAPDGSVWYTDMAAGAVARMTPAGAVSSVPIETPLVRLGRLAVAPDGAVWIAEATSYSITRIEDGRLDRHNFDSVSGGPYGVAVAGDGTVWATLQGGNQLLRIAPDGTLQGFDLPRASAVPTDIAVAPDGTVWFIAFRANRVGRFKDGTFAEFEVGEENAGLSGIAVAEDGTVWFGMLRSGSLGRLREGQMTAFKLPRDDARPYSVAIDRDRNVWYADIHGYVGMLPAEAAGG